MTSLSLSASQWQDFELLDSGNGQKLERFGPYVLARPEVQARWDPALAPSAWRIAHAVYQQNDREGQWLVQRPMERSWIVEYGSLRLRLELGRSRHIGVFPENAVHWDWIGQQVTASRRPVHLLNLFGYTGLATLAAAQAGARVTHVDAAKRAVAWARANQALSGLTDLPVRWIVDDALKYVRREARRGLRYDGIIMDPPAFGRGPGGEVWSFQQLFAELCGACRLVLCDRPLLLVATIYTRSAQLDAVQAAFAAIVSGLSGELASGRLVTREQSAGREIENAHFMRWRSP